ncbi:hypothetical protein ACQP2Y_21835 [Actinoplanes sp. CA-051413]|uniref:hypothetical protein n=1 Tax=Actinoplanes sp. CA-051413 TaxID=3239899 RepID=UPI003D999B05
MIDRPDLDEQDFINRLRLRDDLRDLRRSAGLSCRAVSFAAGLNHRAIHEAESTLQWSVARVQRWARALDRRFTMTIVGLSLPDDDDFEAELLRLATPFGGADADHLHVRAVVNDLRRIHWAQGLSNQALAKKIGGSNRAIARWAEKPHACYLKTLQRYARGLGGSLALEVVPVNVAVSA